MKVARNDRGYRIGASHPNCKLSEETITLILELHDGGLSLGAIAAKFDDPDEPTVSKSMVYKVVHGLVRQQTVDQVRLAQRWIVELHAVCRHERAMVPTAAERELLRASWFPGKTALASFSDLRAIRNRR